MNKIASFVIFFSLTGCSMYYVKQNVASNKYPVSASDSLFDENGNILHGPRVLNLYTVDQDKPQNYRRLVKTIEMLEEKGMYSDLDFYTDRIEALSVIKSVRIQKRVWHWMGITFGSNIDFRDSINEEIEKYGGGGNDKLSLNFWCRFC